jgi:hypothetical protein
MLGTKVPNHDGPFCNGVCFNGSTPSQGNFAPCTPVPSRVRLELFSQRRVASIGNSIHLSPNTFYSHQRPAVRKNPPKAARIRAPELFFEWTVLRFYRLPVEMSAPHEIPLGLIAAA